jgi:Fe-S cluster biosynthesis and repair protein YggX
MKTVNCVKLGKELTALEFAHYPGELGKKIIENISQDAWNEWLNYQTMLINENNLNLMHPEAQTYLKEQMQNFLFGGEVDKIVGYKPEKNA